jgi:hypothetical protein
VRAFAAVLAPPGGVGAFPGPSGERIEPLGSGVAMGVEEACGLRRLIDNGEGGGLRERSKAVSTLSIANSIATDRDLLYWSARFNHAKHH